MVKDEKSVVVRNVSSSNGKNEVKLDTIPRKLLFEELRLSQLVKTDSNGNRVLNEPLKHKWWVWTWKPSKGRLKSNLKFEDDKIYINPWLIKSGGEYVYRDKVFFYELDNRRSVKIPFRQWSFNVLTIPLKIRFGDDTEFSTGANLGGFFGYTWGKTNFVHRKKIGNKEYNTKFTSGIFVGADKIEFSFTDGVDENGEDVTKTVKTAFLSLGSGILFSYEKFTIGLTGGFDFGLAEDSKKWDYQGKPWIGASLGYNLFSF